MLPAIITVNPMARRRKHRRRHGNPFRRRHHSRRHNPFALPSVRSITNDLVPATVGGVGAVGLDVLLAYLPLPAFFASGVGNIIARVGGSLLIGAGVGAVAGKRNGEMAAIGALTVSAYTVIRGFAQSSGLGNSVKGLSGLADFKDYSAAGGLGYQGVSPGTLLSGGRMGAYMRRMPTGAYMRPRFAGVGAYMRRNVGAQAGSLAMAR